MKPSLLCLFILTSALALDAQTTATFESFGLEPGSFLNGSDGSGGFNAGNIFLPNSYDAEFSFWSGWSISSTTDTLTAGFTNQYSAITGSGYEGSTTYAVTFASPASHILLTGDAEGGSVAGCYVTNGTYPYLSMLNGDGFAKQFGGESGDDPDFFLLTIKKYLNGELSTDSIDFYLADYRFDNNEEDYIVKDWAFVDLSPLGAADSLWFSLSSSDVGQFGMNTPAYFCLDNVTTLDRTTRSREPRLEVDIQLFPNPATDRITVDWPEHSQARVRLYNSLGQVLQEQPLITGTNTIAIAHLRPGSYFLQLETAEGRTSRRFVKQ